MCVGRGVGDGTGSDVGVGTGGLVGIGTGERVGVGTGTRVGFAVGTGIAIVMVSSASYAYVKMNKWIFDVIDEKLGCVSQKEEKVPS